MNEGQRIVHPVRPRIGDRHGTLHCERSLRRCSALAHFVHSGRLERSPAEGLDNQGSTGVDRRMT